LPFYWTEYRPVHLIHLGSVVAMMLATLLRDVISQGADWGFAPATLQSRQKNLRTYRNYFVARLRYHYSRPPDEAHKLDFSTCRLFHYIDPSLSWLGGGAKTVKICDNVDKAQATLSARDVHIFDANSLMHVEKVRCSFRWYYALYNYIGVTWGGVLYLNSPGNRNCRMQGRLSFDREGTFDIRFYFWFLLPYGSKGYIIINGTEHSTASESTLLDTKEQFLVVRNVRTVNKVIEISIVGGDRSKPNRMDLGDVVVTPVAP